MKFPVSLSVHQRISEISPQSANNFLMWSSLTSSETPPRKRVSQPCGFSEIGFPPLPWPPPPPPPALGLASSILILRPKRSFPFKETDLAACSGVSNSMNPVLKMGEKRG